mmetsp:Transcript_10110/g.31472  ORF Transcript_10110/g.31472 Transcript_10110/m.31472 type:complete len:193 (+) Transcript_10110:1796-2374(+)
MRVASSGGARPEKCRYAPGRALALVERKGSQSWPSFGLELRPSFCVSLSTGRWAGKVESPTTTSLEQAVAWRGRLLAARHQGWPEFRAEWVRVLSEEREGSSVRLSLAAAEARVESATDRRGGGRARRGERLREGARRRGEAAGRKADRASAKVKAQVSTVACRLGRLLCRPAAQHAKRRSTLLAFALRELS